VYVFGGVTMYTALRAMREALARPDLGLVTANAIFIAPVPPADDRVPFGHINFHDQTDWRPVSGVPLRDRDADRQPSHLPQRITPNRRHSIGPVTTRRRRFGDQAGRSTSRMRRSVGNVS
jgi:hypothetical protein